MGEKIFQRDLIRKALAAIDADLGAPAKLRFSEHHFSHAASAFYASPFERAAVLTMDGVGEWATTTAAIGAGNHLAITREIHFPHSLGLLYSAFTYHTGFKVNSGEYKLMGLAPYGQPRFAQLILDRLIDVKADGSFRLDLDYFDYCVGWTMTNARFDDLFGGPPRQPDDPIEQRHMDLAASIQSVTEEVVLRLTRELAAQSGEANLCLAGGVALNCVANGKVLRDGRFRDIFVQPAAGDAGGALGAALAVYFHEEGQPRPAPGDRDGMQGALLGPGYDQAEIEQRLTEMGARFAVLDEEALIDRTAQALATNQTVGWFQGRMEFGPRALGNRSILADPRSPAMQKLLNLQVKYREDFRPFAPSVLAERVSDWFDYAGASPYMLMVADVKAERRCALSAADEALSGLDKLKAPRSQIPAVTHVDLTARIQTVHADTNPIYHALISRFGAITGCPVLVNTSFNVRGEPIVCTPQDAFHCFMGTDLDLLAIGRCVVEKTQQYPELKRDYKVEFELD